MKTIRRETTAFKRKRRKGRAAVTKGKREREVLELIRAKLESIKDRVWAIRMSQFRGGDRRPDINVHTTGNYFDQFFHIEAKHDERISLRTAFNQAVTDCKSGAVPVACVKRFREPRIAVLWFDDFLDLMLSWLEKNTGGENA